MFAVTVVKLLFAVTSTPSAFAAFAATVYLVLFASGAAGVHLAPSADVLPSTALPLASVTVTEVTLPLVASTASAPSVSTDFAPSAGVMATAAGGAAPLFLPPPPTGSADMPPPVSLGSALPPDEHAVSNASGTTSSPAASLAAPVRDAPVMRGTRSLPYRLRRPAANRMRCF